MFLFLINIYFMFLKTFWITGDMVIPVCVGSLSFFFWPLCCLSFFDLRILITPIGIFKLLLAYQCNCPSVKKHAYAHIKNYKKNMSLVRWIYLAIIDQKVDNQQRLHALNMLCIRTSLEILWIFFRQNML